MPLVFAGTVTSITLLGDHPFGPKRVTFAVSEAFRGGDETSIDLTLRGGSCDPSFEQGESYLVYGRHSWNGGPGWTTDECTRTGKLSERQEDLTYLRLPFEEKGQTRIIGRVVHDKTPLPGVRVRAVGRDRHETITGSDGTYAFYVSAYRSYEVTFDNPPGLVIYGGGEAILPAYRACKAMNGYARYDGRVAGRLTDAKGSPVPNFPLRLENAATDVRNSLERETLTKDDGTFEFDEVQPGSHRIMAHGSAAPSAPPLIRTPLLMGPLARIDAGSVMLPSTLRPTLIEVSVVDPAGLPAAGVGVNVTPAGTHNTVFGLTTDLEGRFAMSVAAGGVYVVSAHRVGHDALGFFVEQAMATVTAVGIKSVVLPLMRTR